MREIKFRAWHAGHKWAEPQMLYDEKPGDCLVWKSQGQNITQVMQYTGLKDKNGRDIYEWDIVRGDTDVFSRMTGKVVYSGVRYVIEGIGKYKNIREELLMTYEVIGNIYENADLIAEV